MSFIINEEMPLIVQNYALYLRNIKGRGSKTVNEYCLDIRTLLRYIKKSRGLANDVYDMRNVSVRNIDIDFIRTITTTEIFEFMNYVADERNNMASTRQRKTSSLKGFFAYLNVHEKLLAEDPTENLTPPKKKKTLPKFLTLDQCHELLDAVDGPDKERDFCIITIFLNCGLRLTELVSINIDDLVYTSKSNYIIINGKGEKERIVYLNEACIEAIAVYMAVRPKDGLKGTDRNALFISKQHKRISVKTVQFIVKKNLDKIGLGNAGYSVHKLRHTAATLMYQYGKVDIKVLQDILGHENLGTTQIYTHTSSEMMKNASESNPLSTVKPNK